MTIPPKYQPTGYGHPLALTRRAAFDYYTDSGMDSTSAHGLVLRNQWPEEWNDPVSPPMKELRRLNVTRVQPRLEGSTL